MKVSLATLAAVLSAPTMVCSKAGAQQTPESPAALDERQYVEEALRAGLEARVADAEAALGRAEGAESGAWANPALAWQREALPSGAGGGGTQDIFSLSLALVPSGRLGLERQAARQGSEAAGARRARARAQLRHEARGRFYGVVGAGERKNVLAESLARLRQLSSVIATREKAGDASGYDRLRIGLEAAAVEDLMRGAVMAERMAQAAALALLGTDRRSLPPLKASLGSLPAGVDRRATAREIESRRADLRALKLEASAAETSRRAAARGWVPELTINGGAQILDAGRPGESRGYVAGVEVPLPLFQRRQGDRARAEARRNLAEASRAALLREAGVRLSALQAGVDERRVRFQWHQVEVLARAEELRKIATTAYRGGASDLLALVDAERVAREARLGAIDLATAVVQSESELALLTGSDDESESGSEKR